MNFYSHHYRVLEVVVVGMNSLLHIGTKIFGVIVPIM